MTSNRRILDAILDANEDTPLSKPIGLLQDSLGFACSNNERKTFYFL